MKKRWAALALTVSMLCALALPAQAKEKSYPDTQGHYAAGVIETWSDYGVLEGYRDGTFRPDGHITRAEMATVVDRVMGYQNTAKNTFTDVPAKQWYAEYILHLAAEGILKGNPDGTMKPDEPITRQEAFATLARVLDLPESDKATGFKDDDTIASWAKGYVAAMKEAGYIQGDQKGNIRANEPITRAEVVTVLNKMAAAFVNKDGTYSKDCKGNLIVNAQDVTLKDMTISGDLIVADGVGDGDVYLENVKVKGTLIIRGGGENSIHIAGDASKYGAIVITKTASGRIRLVSEKGAVIPIVNVNDGKDGVLLEGITETEVVISNDVEVTFGKNVKDIKVAVNASGASVNVTEKATVAKLDVAKTAKDSSISVEKGSKITNVTLAASAVIENNGSVGKTKVEANGVEINGTAPSSITVSKGFDKPTGTGTKVSSGGGGSSSGGSSSSGGGSSSGGSTTTPTPTPSPEPTPEPSWEPSIFLSEATVLMDSPRTGVTAVPPSAAGSGYTAAAEWTPALKNGKFEANTAYTAKVTISPANGDYAFTPDAVDKVELKKTSLNYGANAMLRDISLVDGKVTFTAEYPATSGEVKIVAKLTDGTKVDDTTSSLSLYQDLHCQWLRVEAHLETDGKTIADRPIRYQWSSSSPDMEGNEDDFINPWNSLDWNYTTPTMELKQGTYNYICKVSADGCEPIELKYNVTIKDATGVKIDLSKVRLWNDYDEGLIIDYTQHDPTSDKSWEDDVTLAPQYMQQTYTFQRQDGTVATLVSSGGHMNRSIDIIQDFYNDLYVNGWYPTADTKYEDREKPIDRMEKVTITNIRFEALTWGTDEKGERTPIAEPFDYKCNIKFLPQKTQMSADRENALVYDPAQDTLTFNGLSNGQSSDYKKKLTCSFIIDSWQTLTWGLDKTTMSYPFPVASMNSSSLQRTLHNGESVTAEVRTIAVEAGGEVVSWEPRLKAGEAEVYIEYVEGLQSVVIDSTGV